MIGKFVAVVAIVALAIGCSCQSVQHPTPATPATATAGTPAPGAALNQWEAAAFEVLSDSQAGILKAKDEITSGALPATLKPDLNRAIALQNTAAQTLKTYDATLRAGSDASSQQTEVVSEIGSILQLLVTLQQKRPAQADAAIAPAK